MRFTANIRRSGSVSGSGTVRSGSLHGIDSTSAEDERSFSRADGVSFYDGSEQPGVARGFVERDDVHCRIRPKSA